MPTRSRTRDEDEDEETTTRSRRSPRRRAADDEEEEAPRKRPTRRRQDDDEEEDEKPAARRSRRSKDDDEEEDEAPKSRRRSRRDADDEDEEDDRPKRRSTRSRSRDDDDDDDDEPRGRRSSSRRKSDDDDDEEDDRRSSSNRSAKTAKVKGGWGEADKVRDSTGSFASSLKLEKNETVIIKFLDDSPYVSYRQHWIDEMKGKGSLSYVCLKGLDPKGCPLCDIGDKPSAQTSFNVAVLGEDDDPVVRSWNVGVRLQEKIKNFHKDRMTGPLDKWYYAVTRTGKGGTSDTNMLPVRPKELYEAYGIEPLEDDEMDQLDAEKYDKDILNIPTHRELKDVVRMIDD